MKEFNLWLMTDAVVGPLTNLQLCLLAVVVLPVKSHNSLFISNVILLLMARRSRVVSGDVGRECGPLSFAISLFEFIALQCHGTPLRYSSRRSQPTPACPTSSQHVFNKHPWFDPRSRQPTRPHIVGTMEQLQAPKDTYVCCTDPQVPNEHAQQHVVANRRDVALTLLERRMAR